MALVDWEAVVQDTLAHVRSKNSHGQRELTDFVTDAIVRHRQPEGLLEKAGRAYLPAMIEELTMEPARADRAAEGHDGAIVASSQ